MTKVQTFIVQPNPPPKNFYFKTEKNLYDRFVNAFCFKKLLRNRAAIKKDLIKEANKLWKEKSSLNKDQKEDLIREMFGSAPKQNITVIGIPERSPESPSTSPGHLTTALNLPIVHNAHVVKRNAVKQKACIERIQECASENAGLATAITSVRDPILKSDMLIRKRSNEKEIITINERLTKLKRNAANQAKVRKKKKTQFESGQYVTYTGLGAPLLLAKYPQLNHAILDIVDADEGAASHRRRRNVVNVRSIKHIHEQLRAQATIDISYSSVINYTLPRRPNSISARSHHTPAPVQFKRIERSEMKQHLDGHYCTASQKYLRDLASFLGKRCVFLSQDDKAKVPIGIPAVSRTFSCVQSVNTEIALPDHDFPVGSNHKFIPSFYLICSANASNHSSSWTQEQIACFVRCQLFESSSSSSHVNDIARLLDVPSISPLLSAENGLPRPIWFLSVDGGPDENPR
jgi:hypothetical protein